MIISKNSKVLSVCAMTHVQSARSSTQGANRGQFVESMFESDATLAEGVRSAL